MFEQLNFTMQIEYRIIFNRCTVILSEYAIPRHIYSSLQGGPKK